MTSTLPRQATVIKPYEAAYPEPFRAITGARVKILPSPEEWPGWLWCRADSGELRWVPTNHLDVEGSIGCFSRDYDSTEISAEIGEKIVALEVWAGWVWCRTEKGSFGWLPLECLDLD